MKLSDQLLVIKALESPRYITSDAGILYSYRKSRNRFVMLYPNVANGVVQYLLYVDKKRIRVLSHYVMWLSIHGPIHEKDKIYHRDGDHLNNDISNLAKSEYVDEVPKELSPGGYRTIRSEEIKKIRRMVELGETNCTSIARHIGCHRCAVRYTVSKILKGEKLKNEKVSD